MRGSLVWLIVLVAGLLGCKPALQPVTVPVSPTVSTPTESAPMAAPQVVLTIAPTSASSSAMEQSGFVLTATLGPTCPGPQQEGQVCTAPYEGKFIVMHADGSEVARFNTGVDGRAVVDLSPGRYIVSLAPGAGRTQPRGEPVEVIVVAGQRVAVDLELDTGLR